MRRLVLLLLILSLSACVSRRAKLWDANAIADYPNPVVVFKDKTKGPIIASLYTEDVKKMIYVKDRVEAFTGAIRSQILILDDPAPNAFSFSAHANHPSIAVSIGMINLLRNDPDAMAALIGHELAHLYLEHGKQRASREADRIAHSALLSFALIMVGIPAPMDATNLAATAVANAYSRDEEREADRFGSEHLIDAGFAPEGAVRLLEKLSLAAKDATIPFLSTHPTHSERIENMRQLAQAYRLEKSGVALP